MTPLSEAVIETMESWHDWDKLREMCEAVIKAGGEPYFVGGAVRDWLLQRQPMDVDIEVFYTSFSNLLQALKTVSGLKTDLIGQSFGVLEVRTERDIYHFSVPRTENKVGVGHKDFEVTMGDLTPEEAAMRRDLTVNAMAIKYRTYGLLDPFNGLFDLEQETFEHTSMHFIEDPLRPLRLMKLVGRYGFVVSRETVNLCGTMIHEMHRLPKKRLWDEWYDWAMNSDWPDLGIVFLRDCGWIHNYPELLWTMWIPQEPAWHPEGDVWTHTLQVLERAANKATERSLPKEQRAILMFAALLHDTGKAFTTSANQDGRIVSPGHAGLSKVKVLDFMSRIGAPNKIRDAVAELVEEHMIAANKDEPTHKMVRRLMRRLKHNDPELLFLLIEADRDERSSTDNLYQIMAIYREIVAEEGERIVPLVTGKDLLAVGFKEGPIIGRILGAAVDVQYEEFFTKEEGIRWVLNNVHRLISTIEIKE